MEDFSVYVANAKTSMLSKIRIEIQVLLNALEDEEEDVNDEKKWIRLFFLQITMEPSFAMLLSYMLNLQSCQFY